MRITATRNLIAQSLNPLALHSFGHDDVLFNPFIFIFVVFYFIYQKDRCIHCECDIFATDALNPRIKSNERNADLDFVK